MLNYELTQYEDVIDLKIPVDYDALQQVNYNWVPYNPRKTVARWGCSITSLDGLDSGIPDIDSVLEYNRQHATAYTEKDFTTRTAHAQPFDYFLNKFAVGRSHYIKLGSGGYFPWHRDNDRDTFRIIYTIKNCEQDSFVWINDERPLKLMCDRWYYINTKKKHTVFSFDETVFAVFNVLLTEDNLHQFRQHAMVK
jgi:hypothetical protein